MRSGQQTTPLNEKKMSPAKHNCMFGEGGGVGVGMRIEGPWNPRILQFRWYLPLFHSFS